MSKKKIEFKDQYKHPKWQKKRLEILERDNYTCLDCGDTEKQLHVHHGYYERDKNLWDYENRTLWCLCEDCHKEWDKTKRKIHKMIAYMNLSDAKHIWEVIRSLAVIQFQNVKRNYD